MPPASSVQPVPQPTNNATVTWAHRVFPSFALAHRIHCVPVDEAEEQNYDLVNDILRQLLGGGARGVVKPAIELAADAEVLDCGYGKGAWIDSMLEVNPDALVTGIDIYTGDGGSDNDGDEDNDDDEDDGDGLHAFVKKRWNLNAPFREDLSEDRLRPQTFDFINSRLLSDGINADRWPSYVRELHALLKPGCWLQMVEIQAPFQSSSGRLDDMIQLRSWWDNYSQALQRMGKDARVGPRLGAMMTGAGFREVQVQVLQLPIGPWIPDKVFIGNQTLELIHEMLRDVSMYPFMGISQMPQAQYEALIQGAQRELRLPGLKLYLNVYVCVGRRSRDRGGTP